MKILPTIAALACLISGCLLWLIGFQTAGTALAVSSAILVLAFSAIRPPKKEDSLDVLETRLDWALVITGLGAYVLTRDMFFVVSVAVFISTSPGIMKNLKGLWSK